jgi:sugar phosphate isomerase/epimerase
MTVSTTIHRRSWFGMTSAGVATAAGLSTASPAASARAAGPDAARKPFRLGLNTSTIRGQKLGIVEEVTLAGAAGYDGIEPWIRELDEYVQSGGSLKDLRKRIEDAGLVVYSAIGFPEWVVDDDARRKKGLDEARRNMDTLQQLGGQTLAAPPAGATDIAGMDLRRVAERYRALLDVGAAQGIRPMLELWGFAKSLNRLGETALVALETGHDQACILADVYHLYKGGSPFEGLSLLSAHAYPVFHMNDYPANLPRESIKDADRVYPGDGVAPLTEVLQSLRGVGFAGFLSLELFNPEYWKQDPKLVVETGLAKLRAAVARAEA